MTILLNGNNLSLEKLIRVAKYREKVAIDESCIENINKSRAIVENHVENEDVVYGITTGFGQLCNIIINKNQTEELQVNLIKSHACGIGNEFPEEIVRAIMLLRANNLIKGYSGARVELIQCIIDMINNDVFPVVYEKGSLGASGDLVPLSHFTLVMLGLGEAYVDGKKVSGKIAMEKAGVKTIKLSSKEGLAMINGTQALTAVGAFALWEAMKLAKLSDISGALTMEALNGISNAFDIRVYEIRPHQGMKDTILNINKITKNSKMITKQGEIKTQDAYSIRCMPQMHGASKDTIEFVKSKIEIELNATTDNPLIFNDTKEVISAGNFHGEPLAQALDFLAIGISELANISERRLERLVNPQLSEGLPGFLVVNSGVNSGYMIAQYSAAALVSENKVLSHPASVDSIPSSANQEDIVSMGTISARKALEIAKNTRNVIAIELLLAAQAIDLRGNKGLGEGTKPAYEYIRTFVDFLENDREHYIDIQNIESKLDEILDIVEKNIGKLN